MSYELKNFQEDVLERSRTIPVVVDFWAPWCGPCRTLGPVLEKLAAEQAGRWELVKINSDEHQDLAQQFGVRGIPAVKLIVNGRAVDEFTGALPEYAVRQWLDKALPTEEKKDIAAAEALIEEGQVAEAMGKLEQVLLSEPTNAQAAGLLAPLVVLQDPERAMELAGTAATAEPRFAQAAHAVQTLAHALLRDDFSDLEGEDGVGPYRGAIEAIREGQPGAAIDLLIEVLGKNRYLDDDGARKLGVALFTVLGPGHEVTRSKRRTFDMWLY
ncbi:MAG: thioredoxin [Bacteroidetes bacterium CG12_big_fil_rev_8_21_14_0_65_60_17]|nr:MAG: thioredoxin [Bacteroidetes bacterium CG12_big_fil_rev_8_21_14_0_65_60_17]